MKIVQGIVDHVLVRNTYKHYNVSNKIYFITTYRYKNRLRTTKKQRIHLRLEWLHFVTVDQHMQVCRFLFLPYQPSIFAFFSDITRLVKYRQGWLSWTFTPVIILTNPSSSRLGMKLRVIKTKSWNLFRDVCLAYRSLNLSLIFHSSFKLSYLPLERIHRSILNWVTHQCFVCQMYWQVFHGVKNLGRKILSNLHRIVGMFSPSLKDH